MNVKYKKYINYIARDIELPYIKYLEAYGLNKEDMELVLSKVFNQPVLVRNNHVYDTDVNEIYYEDSDGNGYWEKYEYDNQGNRIYRETSNGFWVKYEYDNQGNRIYLENSTGYWDKYKYDINGNRIYYEDSNGVIMDRR